MTIIESALSHCTFMILHDQQCWNDYLWGITMGTIEPYKQK